MLYQRWLHVAAMQGPERALWDASSGRSWTFSELAAAVPTPSADRSRGFAFPTGHNHAFFLEVLRAWRDGDVVCPLETGQASPRLPLPSPGIIHLKRTSGTTGTAKAVIFSARQLAADTDQIVATMGLRREWVNLGVISLAHSYGFSNLVLPLLLHGIPCVLASGPLPGALAEALRQAPSFALPAVPAMWRAWFDAGVALSAVRLAISAGAPLPVELEQAAFARHGLKIHNFLGASECGGIAYDRTCTPRTDASLVGTAIDGVSISTDAEGCLVVEAQSVGTGYWPAADPRLGRGVYSTRDLAAIGPDGSLALWGRADDLVNLAGRKVLPETVERALRKHPAIMDCLVFGVPATDAVRSEELVACFCAETDERALRDHLLGELPSWQVPRHWWRVTTLSPDGRGKLSRPEWRRKWEAEKRPISRL